MEGRQSKACPSKTHGRPACCGDCGLLATAPRINTALGASAGFDWPYEPRPGETHGSICHGASYEALKAILPKPNGSRRAPLLLPGQPRCRHLDRHGGFPMKVIPPYCLML